MITLNFTEELLNSMASCMIFCAILTFVALLFLKSPYGRYSSNIWGFPVPGRLAWFMQELPSFCIPLFLLIKMWDHSSKLSIVFIIYFLIHYFQRLVYFYIFMLHIFFNINSNLYVKINSILLQNIIAVCYFMGTVLFINLCRILNRIQGKW